MGRFNDFGTKAVFCDTKAEIISYSKNTGLKNVAFHFFEPVIYDWLLSWDFCCELKPAGFVIVCILCVKTVQDTAYAGKTIAVFACGWFCCGNAVFCNADRKAGIPDGKKEPVVFQYCASDQALCIYAPARFNRIVQQV